jgi:phosphate uptake regulator
MAITPQEALGYLLVSRSIERIADHASRIARYSAEVKGSEPTMKEISDLGRDVVTLFDESVMSLGSKEFDLIDGLIRSAETVQERTRVINKRVLSMGSEEGSPIALAFILDSLERIRSYSVDICEISINHMFVSHLNAGARGGARDGN